jgi:hypothetical protein
MLSAAGVSGLVRLMLASGSRRQRCLLAGLLEPRELVVFADRALEEIVARVADAA